MDQERSRSSTDRLRTRARAGLPTDPTRAGARSHCRAMGIEPSRLAGPIVGVASTWTGTMPCNRNHLDLAEHAAASVNQAGDVALPFNTIAVSDKAAVAGLSERLGRALT